MVGLCDGCGEDEHLESREAMSNLGITAGHYCLKCCCQMDRLDEKQTIDGYEIRQTLRDYLNQKMR